MGATDSVWKDVLGPALSLVSVLVMALVAFSHKRLEARLRKDVDEKLKGYEAALKLHVDTQVQRVRGEVERDLKNHEVRLRVAADIRLKMLDRMLADVADYRSKLGAGIGAISMLAHEVEPNGGRTERARELLRSAELAFAALSGAGPFVPADLHSSATEIANEFNDCLREVVEWSNLPTREERTQKCHVTVAKMETISVRSKKLFGGWQAAQFSSFSEMLDCLGNGDSVAIASSVSREFPTPPTP